MNINTATIDHRTGSTFGGGPASAYHRVSRPQQHVPNYAARRLGVLLVAISAALMGVWVVEQAAGGFGGATVLAADTGAGDEVRQVHVARDGESLWSIADQHRGEVDRDRYVDALVLFNGGTTVYVGQAVQLP